MQKKSAISSLIITITAVLFNVFLILYPQDVIAAAKDGLSLWFNNVLPSLLPFIIGINTLSGLGFINFMGALMSPLMIPFGVSGTGGFALLSGLLSGYPMGAKVTAQLREDGLITQIEAQRLIGFSNNAGSLFIIGVVGVGLFGSLQAGYLILMAHIAGALATGLILRWLIQPDTPPRRSRGLLKQAWQDMALYRQSHECSLGYVLGNSVANAMESITLIGGFIILFCVIAKVLTVIGAVSGVCALLDGLLPSRIPDTALAEGSVLGILEITNGVRTIAQSVHTPTVGRTQVVLAAAVISFGGFSIHAQTIHFLQKTDIKIPLYLFSKNLHAILSALICWLLAPVFNLSVTVSAMRVWGTPFIQWIIPALAMVAVLIFPLLSGVKIPREE